MWQSKRMKTSELQGLGPELIKPTPWMMLPFGLLLLAIALGPLVFPRFWAKHYPKVAYGLGAVALAYYLGALHAWERVLHVGHD